MVPQHARALAGSTCFDWPCAGATAKCARVAKKAFEVRRGKTLIASLIASQTKRSFYPLTATSVLGGGVGDSVKRVAAVFARAKEHSPAIVFLDEMDGLLPANNRYLAQHDV